MDGFVFVLLAALAIIGLAVLGMAVGVMTTGRCLRGTCGGPAARLASGEKVACAGCPNRPR